MHELNSSESYLSRRDRLNLYACLHAVCIYEFVYFSKRASLYRASFMHQLSLVTAARTTCLCYGSLASSQIQTILYIHKHTRTHSRTQAGATNGDTHEHAEGAQKVRTHGNRIPVAHTSRPEKIIPTQHKRSNNFCRT